MKLIIVRHGATEWSVSGQHTGLTDIPLTVDGVAQARAARKLVERLLGPDTLATTPVFSSPLQRARATAEIVFAGCGALTTDDRLVEFNYGDYEGLTSAQIHALTPGWEIWRDGCPNGETCAQVGDRVDQFLIDASEAAAAIPHDTVALVAHGHVIRMLAARAVDLPASQGQIFTLDTATVSVIEDVRGKRVIKMWNVSPSL